MRKLKVILAGLLLVISGTGIALTMASPASAVTCYGDYCSGQDPHATGCDADAYTVVSIDIPSTQAPLELRWSPTCKTNWARVPAGFGVYYPNQLEAVQSTGYKQVGVVASNEYYSWSRMIYSPTFCVYAGWVGPPGSVSTWCD